MDDIFISHINNNDGWNKNRRTLTTHANNGLNDGNTFITPNNNNNSN